MIDINNSARANWRWHAPACMHCIISSVRGHVSGCSAACRGHVAGLGRVVVYVRHTQLLVELRELCVCVRACVPACVPACERECVYMCMYV